VVWGGWLVLALLLAGAFFVLFFTFPLKYIGLGEVAVLLVWGPLMVGGGFYAITHVWNWEVVLVSLPYALATTTVLFGKHIDKSTQDDAMGIRTLPVIIGEKAARYVVLVMIALQYLLVFYLITVGILSWAFLVISLALSALKPVIPIYLEKKPDECPPNYPSGVWPLYYVAAAFYHTRIYGIVFLCTLVLDTVWKLIF